MAERRDWLRVASNPSINRGRALTASPYEIALQITHRRINYGTIIETADDGYVFTCLKQVLFRVARDTITELSRAALLEDRKNG